MVTEIKEYRNKLEQLKGQRQSIQNSLSERNILLDSLNKKLDNSLKAQVIIQTVGQQTQSKLEAHISNLVSMALASVFDNPYQFHIEFVLRRNKTECDLWFVRDGERINPIDSSGGGAVDIAALALRIALWTLSRDRLRNTLILDEPCKHLSKNLHANASEMLQQISQKLGLQLIVVTHSPELTECADKVFTVSLKDGKSQVVG